MSKEEKFNFKNLLVWQKALKFAAKVINTTEHLKIRKESIIG